MSKRIWLFVVGAVVIVGAISIIALPKGPEWTTASPEALAEFERAMEASKKLYHDDAARYLERAIELDPDFVTAKVMLSQMMKDDKELKKRLENEVRQADLDRLQPRERFFVERQIAAWERDRDEVTRIIDQYLERYPDDPFIVEAAAIRTFSIGDYETSERLNRRLLEISPNWVLAYNQLGYITMLQGRFAEAEEYFTSYRFIAPDQANPHDSLGELYIIQGRYPEAAQSIETALDIKSDFWLSYQHLVLARLMMGDEVGAREAAAAAENADNAPDWLRRLLRCEVEYFEREFRAAWNEILEMRDGECSGDGEHQGDAKRVFHRAASQLGEWDVALEIEKSVREAADAAKEKGATEYFEIMNTMLHHMAGVRLALSGDLEAAADGFSKADDGLTYRESGIGMFKLYNRLFLVETLLARGQDAEAHKLLAKVRAVNPVIVGDFEEQGLKLMGLARG
jgi:tetratricopeptide (TPR) repeat protein